MSAWKKPSRNTWVKKISTPARASAGMSTPFSRRSLDLRDRHAVHALHHHHALRAQVPVHLGHQRAAASRRSCAAAGSRWPPRASGRARRPGGARTRPPPRAASAAGRRPTGARPGRPRSRAARGPSRSPRSTPGRSTLTATSRPSCRRREVHLGDRGARHRLAFEAWRTPRRCGRPRRARSRRSRARMRNGGTRSCSLRQLVGDVERQQVAPRREHLAELHEDRAERLERLAQPLAARLAAATGEHAKDGRRIARHELVQPEAQADGEDAQQPREANASRSIRFSRRSMRVAQRARARRRTRRARRARTSRRLSSTA